MQREPRILTVGRQSVTITQPANSCTYSLDANTYPVAMAGGTVSATLTATAGCPWAVTNNYSSAISFTSASSGTGNGVISMTVTANPSLSTRTFYLSVGDAQIQISQSNGVFPQPSITSGPGYDVFSVGDVQSALIATGGTPPYTWSISGGSLPAGVYIRTDTPSFFAPGASAGLIGVATAPGTSNVTL